MAAIGGLYAFTDTVYRDFWATNCLRAEICDPGQTAEQLSEQLQRAVDRGQFDFDPKRGIAVYLVFGGGVVAAIGGIAGLRRGKTTTAYPAQAGYPQAPTAQPSRRRSTGPSHLTGGTYPSRRPPPRSDHRDPQAR